MGLFNRMKPRILLAACFALILCSRPASGDGNEPPVYGYKVSHTYRHDIDAFTQGLAFEDGILYEGTGGYGTSNLRKTRLENAEILRLRTLPPNLFGEGITIFGDKLIQLTWKSKTGFIYDKKTLTLLRTFRYDTQGWGITHDKKQLIMSDGTSNITFLDPNTFKVTDRLKVHDNNTPLTGINELEFVRGKIYANIWPTDRIVIIAPDTGKVEAWIDLAGLLTPAERTPRMDVLNGIAYDEENERLFVTGKRWPKLFHIQLTPSK